MPNNKIKKWDDVYNVIQVTESERIMNSLRRGELVYSNQPRRPQSKSRAEILEEGLTFRKTPPRERVTEDDIKWKTKSAIIITGTATNKYNQIGQVVDQLDGGPYYANGRDNKLTYQNTKARDPVIFSYTYNGGNGELISFEVDTEFTVSMVEASISTDINPETKEVETEVNHVVDTRDWGLSGQIIMERDNTRTLYPDLVNRQTITHPSDHIYDPSLSEEQIQRFGARDDFNKRFNSNHIVKRPTIYSSEEEAEASIKNSFEITPEIYDEYIQSLRERHERIRAIRGGDEGTTQGNYHEYVTDAGYIPDYLLKRKVIVEQYVDPQIYLPRGRGTNKAGGKTYKQVSEDWKTSFYHLNKVKGITIEEKGPGKYAGYEVNEKVLIRKEVELEIGIPGIRILAGRGTERHQNDLVHDMIKNIENKITANARVIGNPLIESSMNIEIKGVSKRYSGKWYTKEVTHSFDDNGYFCDISFVEKDISVLSAKIKSNTSTLRNYDELNGLDERVKRALENKSHLRRAAIKSAFKKSEFYQTEGNYNIMVDPSDPNKADIYWADEDMFGYKESKVGTIYITPKEETNN